MEKQEKTDRPRMPKIGTISRSKALEMIDSANGKIFTVSYIKKNGQERTLNCRRGVAKGVKGTGRKLDDRLGLMLVYSMKDKGYKNVVVPTMYHIKINKTEFKIK